MLNGLDLFSGIGGLTLALAPWVRPIAYCESDRFAQAILLSRMRDGVIPISPIWDDVQTLTMDVLPTNGIDIIYGGFPCQDISIAGARKGLEGKRSVLFFEIIRLARQLRPKFIFLENTPAITSLGLDRVLLEITSLGFDCRWTVISAGELGAPHLRERWWLYAYSDRAGLQVTRRFKNAKSARKRSTGNSSVPLVQRNFWKKSPSVICRMDDGISPKTHRLRALGNAVVPFQAREAFKRLAGL